MGNALGLTLLAKQALDGRYKVINKSHAEVVKRAGYSLSALLENISVDHRCRHIVVPEERLNGADVGSALKQMRGKTVPKCVSADLFGQSGSAHRCFDCLVDHAGIHMVAPHRACQRIGR